MTTPSEQEARLMFVSRDYGPRPVPRDAVKVFDGDEDDVTVWCWVEADGTPFVQQGYDLISLPGDALDRMSILASREVEADARPWTWIAAPDVRVEQYRRTWATLLETYRGDVDTAVLVLMAGMDQIANERESLRAMQSAPIAAPAEEGGESAP